MPRCPKCSDVSVEAEISLQEIQEIADRQLMIHYGNWQDFLLDDQGVLDAKT